MMLALTIIACLASAMLAAWWSARVRSVGARLSLPTLVAILAPLAGVLLVFWRAVPPTSSTTFRVTGQYLPRDAAVRFGDDSTADVRLGLGLPIGVAATITRVASKEQLRVSTNAGMALVTVGGKPVNAARLGRSATVVVAGTSFEIAMPRWPASCLLGFEKSCAYREIRSAGSTQRVKLTESGVALNGVDSASDVMLVRSDGHGYVWTDEPARVTVNGAAIPTSATLDADPATVVAFGRGRIMRHVRLTADRVSGRQIVAYGDGLLENAWPLIAGTERQVYRVTTAKSASDVTLPELDLSEWPLGASNDYSGVLEWTGKTWRWHAHGRADTIAIGAATYLPGATIPSADRGHVVRLASSPSPIRAIAILAALWLLGAIALSVRPRSDESSWLRTAILGFAYTLVAVRVVLAVRVAIAPPAATDTVTSTIVLLATLPMFVIVLERWSVLWPAGQGRARLRQIGILAAALLAAPVTVFAASGGNVELSLLSTGILAIGIGGLWTLQQLLMPPGAERYASDGPFAMLAPPSEPRFEILHLVRATLTLAIVVLFYIWIDVVRRGVPSIAAALGHIAVVAWLWLFLQMRSRVVPRFGAKAVVIRAAVLGATIVLPVALVVGEILPKRGPIVALATGLAAGLFATIMLVIAAAPLIRPAGVVWPVVEGALPPSWFAFGAALPILVANHPAVRRLSITLGFALGVMLLVLLTRVVTLVWQRDARERLRLLMGAGGRRISIRFLLTVLAIPLALVLGHLFVDRGLLQLLFMVLAVSLLVGSSAMGWRGLTAPALLLGAGMLAWFAFVRVDANTLQSKPVSLSTPRIRYAAVASPDALEDQLLYADHQGAREIVSTLVQDWGMQTYPARSGVTGPGLFQAPFADRAIGAREALTDNVFSVFVLGEHGFAGGLALLLLYATLAASLLVAAWFAARTFAGVPFAVLLSGCAAFIAVPSLYMAAANLHVVPLTGQNLLLLGLRSGADVALATWIVGIALCVLPRRVSDPQRDQENAPAMRRVRYAVAGLVGVVGLAVGGLVHPLWKATHASPDNFHLPRFRAGLETLIRDGAIANADGHLVVANGMGRRLGYRSGSLLYDMVRRVNGSPAPRSSHCLDQIDWIAPARGGVAVRDACVIPLAEGGRDAWLGSITTKPAGFAHVLATDTSMISLDSSMATASPSLGPGCAWSSKGTRFDIRCAHAAVVITAGASGLQIASTTSGVFVNGQLLSKPQPLTRGTIVSIDSAVTLVADTIPRAALTFAHWSNGRIARVVTPSASPLIARMDSLIAPRLRLAEGAKRQDVELTIDPALSTKVMEGLSSTCGQAMRCSVILVRPDRGDILTIASVTDSGYKPGPFEPLDANFRNHRAASAIKPILASAILAAYPQLASLSVQSPNERFQMAAGWPLAGSPMHSPFHGCPTQAQGIVDWRCFLPTSNNLFAVTLGFLGAAERGPTGPQLASGPTAPGFHIAGHPSTGRPRFEVRNGSRRYDQSPLATNLAALFDAPISVPGSAFDTSLWAPLTSRGALKLSPAFQRVSPAMPNMPLERKEFQDLRHLAGFMIGATENSWSNFTLARSMSRIFVGKHVDLRLINRVGDTLLPVSTSDGGFGAGRRAVLEGLRGVVGEYGTARIVAANVPSHQFTFVAKTGTLDSDGFDPVSSFMFAGGAGTPDDPKCAVAGVVFVEAVDSLKATPMTAKELFAKVVAPALRTHVGWGTGACGAMPTPQLAGTPVARVAATEPAPVKRTKPTPHPRGKR